MQDSTILGLRMGFLFQHYYTEILGWVYTVDSVVIGFLNFSPQGAVNFLFPRALAPELHSVYEYGPLSV